MATASTIAITPDTAGIGYTAMQNLTAESCQRVTELLQKNHDVNHIYFNESGFHNHIAHHLLTVFALGGTVDQLQYAYDTNKGYQRPQMPVHREVVESMSSPATFAKCLNKEQYFHDYEVFFSNEIDRLGSWGQVVRQYLLADTDQARDMLGRLFSGVYHPAIHLGFGIEFEQPAIIVEALAMTATHDNKPRAFLDKTSELAHQRQAQGTKSASLFDLIAEIQSSPKLRQSVKWDDSSKLGNGVWGRAMPEMTELASKWYVQPTTEDLRLKTAEMINACIYFTGAAQHSSGQKQVKMDFFYIHAANSSIFHSTFLESKHDSWLKNEDRAKLLEMKAWMDLAVFTAWGSPDLFTTEIKQYTPQHPKDGWAEIFQRADSVRDDGHASKLIRALAHGEHVCKEFEGKQEAQDWKIKGDMWLKLGHMAIDNVSSSESTLDKWVRGAGFEEAWGKVPARL